MAAGLKNSNISQSTRNKLSENMSRRSRDAQGRVLEEKKGTHTGSLGASATPANIPNHYTDQEFPAVHVPAGKFNPDTDAAEPWYRQAAFMGVIRGEDIRRHEANEISSDAARFVPVHGTQLGWQMAVTNTIRDADDGLIEAIMQAYLKPEDAPQPILVNNQHKPSRGHWATLLASGIANVNLTPRSDGTLRVNEDDGVLRVNEANMIEYTAPGRVPVFVDGPELDEAIYAYRTRTRYDPRAVVVPNLLIDEETPNPDLEDLMEIKEDTYIEPKLSWIRRLLRR